MGDAAVDVPVVVLESPRGRCSGAVVHQSGGQTWVLTAAHCVTDLGPTLSVRWQDEALAVVATQTHPSYQNGPAFDVAVVQIDGLRDTVPVVPLAATDDLKVGLPVEHFGFAHGASRGTVAEVRPLTLRYEDGPGGPCAGDSGGPDIVGGRLVGVMSRSDALCREWAVSTRVSAVYDSFLAPLLFGAPMSLVPCAVCRQAATEPGAACVAPQLRCNLTGECGALAACACETCARECETDTLCR